MEHVRITPFDSLEELAELERWEEADRKRWHSVANLFDDWTVAVEEEPRQVTATRGGSTVSEEVRDEDERPVLDSLVRLSDRLDR
jgi:hypothetical protein